MATLTPAYHQAPPPQPSPNHTHMLPVALAAIIAILIGLVLTLIPFPHPPDSTAPTMVETIAHDLAISLFVFAFLSITFEFLANRNRNSLIHQITQSTAAMLDHINKSSIDTATAIREATDTTLKQIGDASAANIKEIRDATIEKIISIEYGPKIWESTQRLITFRFMRPVLDVELQIQEVPTDQRYVKIRVRFHYRVKNQRDSEETFNIAMKEDIEYADVHNPRNVTIEWVSDEGDSSSVEQEDNDTNDPILQAQCPVTIRPGSGGWATVTWETIRATNGCYYVRTSLPTEVVNLVVRHNGGYFVQVDEFDYNEEPGSSLEQQPPHEKDRSAWRSKYLMLPWQAFTVRWMPKAGPEPSTTQTVDEGGEVSV